MSISENLRERVRGIIGIRGGLLWSIGRAKPPSQGLLLSWSAWGFNGGGNGVGWSGGPYVQSQA
jgi:hypothetical protein